MSRAKRPSSRPRQSDRQQKKKKGNPVKSAVYIGVLVIAVGYLGWFLFYEFGFRTDYNTVVAELDGAFQTADEAAIKSCTEKLEKLYKSNKSKPERATPIKDHLLKCYRHFSSNPGLSLKEQIAYFEKINELDPKALSDADKKLMEVSK
jgi:hypothetical protein